MKVWHQGRIGDASTFSVSILDHGLLYGDGVFEGIRITGGRIFCLDAHLARLAQSAASIGLELPHGSAELRQAVIETAAANGANEAYVRIVVTRGVGELGVDPLSCREPQLFCIVATLAMFSAQARQTGLRLMTSWLRRPRGDALDPQVKSLNYLNNVMAKRDARLKGFDDAVLLNADGRVAEASGANIFAVIDDTLITPPCSEGALGGITRANVLRCHAAMGAKGAERPLTRHELLHASEVFVCGSGAGLVAVASLDNADTGSADRPMLQAISEAWPAWTAKHGTAF